MIDDRDVRWLRPRAEASLAPPASEQIAWKLVKRDHAVVAVVRASGFGPELRIAIDGEVFWSRVFYSATEEWLTAEVDRRRDEFIAKGWVVAQADETAEGA